MRINAKIICDLDKYLEQCNYPSQDTGQKWRSCKVEKEFHFNTVIGLQMNNINKLSTISMISVAIRFVNGSASRSQVKPLLNQNCLKKIGDSRNVNVNVFLELQLHLVCLFVCYMTCRVFPQVTLIVLTPWPFLRFWD